MPIEVVGINAHQLSRYERIPIRFRVASRFRVDALEDGLGGLRLVEEKVDPPYIKDYDALLEGRESPSHWPSLFDLSHWGCFLALAGEQDVGGAAVAMDTPGVHMLEARTDLAVLWDIRVRPDARGRGVGRLLFWQAVDWARTMGSHQLKVETQNVNVGACRFYARQGCRLGSIHRYAYAACPEVAHEAMLLWYLDL